jgi:putative PIN family toxin of toxin-antitoxin system
MPRIVIDTNVYVSRFLRPSSVPGKAVEQAWLTGRTLVSKATIFELRAVLVRDKFARYIQQRDLEPYFHQVWDVAEQIHIQSTIRACSDPKDNKFLELAVDGRADLILTGDSDLLALHPFHGIGIMTPMQFLAGA